MHQQAIGHDWFQLTKLDNPDEYEQLTVVPGIQVYRKPGLTKAPIDRLMVHRSHLPLIPAYRPISTEPSISPNRPSTFKLPFELHDYQQEAIDFISTRRGVLLCHDLGLGKTIIALAAMSYPALMVVPKSAIRVWKLEAERVGLKIQVLSGRKLNAKLLTNDIDLFIVNYSNAPYWMGCFRKLGIGPTLASVGSDESHALQKKKLQWTQAFNSIHRDLTLLLTATPARNRLSSLWSLLDAINPRAWGTQYAFRLRYCGAYKGEYGLVDGNPTYCDELQLRLAEVAISESWQDPEFAKLRPKLHRDRVHVIAQLEEKELILQDSATSALETMALTGHQGTTLKYLTAQRKAVGKLKAEWLRASDYLHDHASGARTIWWCWHKETVKLLEQCAKDDEIGCPIDVVTGSVDSNKRETILKEWQFGDMHEPRMLIATLGAMSSAVNLVTAQAAYFVELDYAPLNIIQAEKRHHRPGNHFEEVEAHYIIAAGTIDGRLSQALLDKVSETEMVFGDMGQQDQIATLFGTAVVPTEKDVLIGLAKRIIGIE